MEVIEMFEQRKIENELIRRDIEKIIQRWKKEKVIPSYAGPKNVIPLIMIRKWKILKFISKVI